MVGALRVVSVEPVTIRGISRGSTRRRGTAHGCALDRTSRTQQRADHGGSRACLREGCSRDLKAAFRPHFWPKAGRSIPPLVASVFEALRKRLTIGSGRAASRPPTQAKRVARLMRYHGQGGELAIDWEARAVDVERLRRRPSAILRFCARCRGVVTCVSGHRRSAAGGAHVGPGAASHLTMREVHFASARAEVNRCSTATSFGA